MIPFTDFLYFGISLYVLIPALVAGFLKRGWRIWLVIATIVMLIVQYVHTDLATGFSANILLLLIGYALAQWLNAGITTASCTFGSALRLASMSPISMR